MKRLLKLEKKILTRDELNRRLAYYRFRNQKIVFTNGCFDLLHAGHVEYLRQAAQEGDVLIIGLNSDASVTRLKGEGRPLQTQQARALTLAALSFVDVVVIFDEDTPYELIKTVQPHALVKGSDYRIEEIVGHDVVLSRGGVVFTIPLVLGYSTTTLIEKIRKKIPDV